MRTALRLRTHGACVLIAFVLFAAANVLPRPALADNPPLKVGEFLDLTGGGASAAEAARLGVDLAIKEINAGGGIAGRTLQVITADTQTDPTIGVGEMKRLVQQDKVEVLFGPLISQVLMAALPIVNEAKVPEMGSTGSELITPAAAPYYFSLLINAESQAKAMIAQAEQTLHVKSGAIISDSGAQSQSFVESMKKEMTARGITLTGVQQYQYRTTDMTPQLLTLKRGKPDTLFLFASSGEDAGNVLKSLGDVDWSVKVTGNYTVATFAKAALAAAGADAFHAHDVTGINYKAFTYCTGQDIPKAFLDFVAKAKAFRPADADRLSMAFAATLYDGVHLMKDAIEGSGGKTDGPTITAWIEANAKNYKGIIQGFSPSAQSHFLVGPNALTAVYPDRVREGGLQQRYGCTKS